MLGLGISFCVCGSLAVPVQMTIFYVAVLVSDCELTEHGFFFTQFLGYSVTVRVSLWYGVCVQVQFN